MAMLRSTGEIDRERQPRPRPAVAHRRPQESRRPNVPSGRLDGTLERLGRAAGSEIHGLVRLRSLGRHAVNALGGDGCR